MNNAGENIKSKNLDSFLIILILLFGLLIWHNSDNPPLRTGHLVTSEFSVSSHDAVICSGTVFQAFNRIVVSQNEKLFQLSFARIQVLENKKTEQTITILQNAGINTDNNPSINFRYILFPSERDDLPPLG